MCHTRELAFQIAKEYERFSKYLNNIKVGVFFGGLNIKKDEETIKTNCPHIVVATPGRLLALGRQKILNLKHIKHFVLDECDKMLDQLGKQLILFIFSVCLFAHLVNYVCFCSIANHIFVSYVFLVKYH